MTVDHPHAAPSVPTVRREPRVQALSALLGLFVGSFAANTVPHLVQGLAGTTFFSPLGSSPTANLIWSATNAALAVALGYLVARRRLTGSAFRVGALVGVVGTAVSLLLMT